jgi:predicted glutamine amidotransferase
MCRLFGAISNHSIDAPHLLSGAPQSLLKQSHIDRKRPQGDGWGAGWFEGGKPRVLKSSRPMYRDRKRVRLAGARAKGNVLIGHVRWASNPLKLQRAELIGLPHTQPFVHGKWLFAHNGTLFIPKEVAARLGPWKKYLQGKNDSEVLFYWLLKHLFSSSPRRKPGSSDVNASGFRLTTTGMTDVAQAVRQAIRGLHEVWETCKKSYPIHAYPYHGLNWVLSDGKTLIAFCYSDPKGFGKSKALCNTRERYYQLRRQITKDHVLVASEPIDVAAPWENFRHGELLIAQQSGQRLRVSKIPLV